MSSLSSTLATWGWSPTRTVAADPPRTRADVRLRPNYRFTRPSGSSHFRLGGRYGQVNSLWGSVLTLGRGRSTIADVAGSAWDPAKRTRAAKPTRRGGHASRRCGESVRFPLAQTHSQARRDRPAASVAVA